MFWLGLTNKKTDIYIHSVMLNVKNIVFFSILVCCFSRISSQVWVSDYYSAYNEKTKIITKPFDTILNYYTLNVFPTFVDYRLFTKEPAQTDLFENGIVARSINLDSNYISYPRNARLIKVFFGNVLADKLSSLTNINRPVINKEDSAFFVRELKRIKTLFKDSSINKYEMSDSLYQIFKKYPAEHEVLADIFYCQNKHFASKCNNAWVLVKFYVFDMRIKELIYYSYKYRFTGYRYDVFSQTDVPTGCIYILTKLYTQYSKENKKYLKTRNEKK